MKIMTNRANVRLLRLLSGEDILAEVVPKSEVRISGNVELPIDTDEGPLTIKNPYQVISRPDGKGGVSVGLGPWIIVKEDTKDITVTVRATAIVYVITPDSQMTGKFMELTTGLILPEKGLLSR
jgi:hypothetical protein